MARYNPRVEICFDKTSNPEILQNWTWTDVTALLAGPAVLSRGRQDEASRATTSSVGFALRNDDGVFTPGLATSPYYEKFEVGTPVRVTESNLLNNSRLYLNGQTDSFSATVDHSSLDIVGDIDIRADIELDEWRSETGYIMVVGGKWTPSGNQRSYVLNIEGTGLPSFYWSTDGTLAGARSITATTAVPANSGRLAIRVAFDVDNGASGRTATFYTAPSMSGTWTQLGAPVVASGVTSLFSSSSSLYVGVHGGTDNEFVGGCAFQGRVYSFQVRSSINGTVVANPDFSTLRGINTTLTDSTGKGWGINPAASIEDPATRAFGFVNSIEPEWPAGDIESIQTGHSMVAVKAAGVFRAMEQKAEPLDSVMTRSTLRTTPAPIEYWPCEDGDTAKQCASALGGDPMRFVYMQNGTTEPDFSSYSDFVASKPVVTLNNGTMYGTLPAHTQTNEMRVTALVHVDETEAGDVLTDIRVMELQNTGTAGFWYIDINRTTGALAVHALAPDTSSILDTGYMGFNMLGKKFLLSLWLVQNGANIDWQIAVFEEGSFAGGVVSSSLASRTLGKCRSVTMNSFGTFNKGAFGHVSYYTTNTANVIWQIAADVLKGYQTEPAGTRFARLCREEGVEYDLYGWPADTAQMGPQGVDTLTNLLQECADVDDGILSETRWNQGLTFRTRFDMYDRPAKLTLDASSSSGGDIFNPFKPVTDDSKAVNDSTATREGGSSFRVTDDADIAKRGRYPSDRTMNLASDGQLPDAAGWILRNGTLRAARYANVVPAIDVNLTLELPYARLNLGDKIVVDNLPSQHPADAVELILQGYNESLWTDLYQIECNTTPGVVFDIAEFAVTEWNTGTDSPNRADADGCTLTTAVNTTDTTLLVRTDHGYPEWVDYAVQPAEFPLDIGIGGEQIRVATCTQLIRDTFTRTVSNGWGTADTGGNWSIDGGVAGNFAVSSGTGKHTGATAGVFRTSYLGSAIAEPDVILKVRAPVNATGDLYGAGATLCWNGSGQFYMVMLSFTTANNVEFFISTNAGILGSFGITNLKYTAGDWFWLRASAFDGNIMGRVWKDGDIEPSYWQGQRTSTLNPYTGSVGCISVRGASNTNANLPFEFDFFKINSHQVMTTTRSVNTVTKSHAAGDTVSLWTPAVAAR